MSYYAMREGSEPLLSKFSSVLDLYSHMQELILDIEHTSDTRWISKRVHIKKNPRRVVEDAVRKWDLLQTYTSANGQAVYHVMTRPRDYNVTLTSNERIIVMTFQFKRNYYFVTDKNISMYVSVSSLK